MTVANGSAGKISHLPVIGIVPSQNTSEKMVSFPERYADAIIKAGGAPLLLPLSGNSHIYETLFPLIDGFVLTGGNDIDPARYGAIRDSGKIDEHTPEREELEYLILSYAYRFDLPLMGHLPRHADDKCVLGRHLIPRFGRPVFRCGKKGH